MWRLALILLLPQMANADSLIATRIIRAQSVLAETDMTLVAAEIPGALTDPANAVGQEARVTLYAGRPIRLGDLGSPSVVDRNQLVPLSYQVGSLTILTEGRALARGGAGDMIRVMNLDSHATVTGRITADGMVQVNPNP